MLQHQLFRYLVLTSSLANIVGCFLCFKTIESDKDRFMKIVEMEFKNKEPNSKITIHSNYGTFTSE